MTRRPSDVPRAVVRELNSGTREAANLAESLSIDFAVLLAAACPGIDGVAVETMRSASDLGVTRRMPLAASLAASHFKRKAPDQLAAHASDTVRGWACFVIADSSASIEQALDSIKPLAADPHFGVREWAWMSVRRFIVADPFAAVGLLEPWVHDDDPSIRRFATEATRPRGVWCKHIGEFRRDPAPGLALLEPLRSDPEKYVQDSVSNWLNDAVKDNPAWVRGVCKHWLSQGDDPAVARVCRRAVRSASS